MKPERNQHEHANDLDGAPHRDPEHPAEREQRRSVRALQDLEPRRRAQKLKDPPRQFIAAVVQGPNQEGTTRDQPAHDPGPADQERRADAFEQLLETRASSQPTVGGTACVGSVAIMAAIP